MNKFDKNMFAVTVKTYGCGDKGPPEPLRMLWRGCLLFTIIEYNYISFIIHIRNMYIYLLYIHTHTHIYIDLDFKRGLRCRFFLISLTPNTE